MELDLSGTQCVWLATEILWPPGQDDIPLEAMKLLTDPEWTTQTKEDGTHVIVARTQDKIKSFNRKGEPHAIPPATAKALMDLPPNTLLDGEKLHEGGYVLFDTMYVNDKDLRNLPYSARLAALNQQVLPRVDRSVVRIVEYEVETKQKLAMVNRIRAANGEGIILKSLQAKYTPGRPESGVWTMRKLKFIKELTCICQRRPINDPNNKASFEMFVLDGNKPVNIGQVTAQQFYNQIEPGRARIADIQYLYATPSDKVVQPRLKRPDPWRTDKSAEECTLDQLVRGGRFAGK